MEQKSIMHGVALTALKDMNDEDRKICSKFVMKQLMKRGHLTEDDSRAIIEFDLKNSERRHKAIEYMKAQGIEID